MTSNPSAGLIGLGIMGSAFARNLIGAGFRVVAFDVDAGRREAMGEVGVEIVESAGAVAAATGTILCSLPGDRALADTVRGVIESGAAKRTLIETSTLALDSKLSARKALAAAGHVLLDCPVSGTGAQAKNRDLTVYASGDSAAIEAVPDVFKAIAKVFFNLGAFGNGSKMKYVANLLVCIHNVAAAEALVLGMKAGLDPAQIVDVVKHGAGGSRMLEVRGPMMAAGRYEPITAGFPLYHKDLDIIGEFAMGLECPTPLLDATLPFYLAGGSAYPDSDVAAVCAVLEKMAGVKRPG